MSFMSINQIINKLYPCGDGEFKMMTINGNYLYMAEVNLWCGEIDEIYKGYKFHQFKIR